LTASAPGSGSTTARASPITSPPGWPRKSRTLKPTTAAVYTDYIVKDLIPAFGAGRLEKLNHLHVARFIDEQLAAGRGPTT
jgi:Phage integrase, N-terminal SAM-like domain